MAAAPSTSRKAVSRKSVGSELSMGNLSAQGASPSHEPSGMIRRSASNANSVWSDISASSSQPSPNQRDSASLANNNIQNSFLQPRMKVCGFCGTDVSDPKGKQYECLACTALRRVTVFCDTCFIATAATTSHEHDRSSFISALDATLHDPRYKVFGWDVRRTSTGSIWFNHTASRTKTFLVPQIQLPGYQPPSPEPVAPHVPPIMTSLPQAGAAPVRQAQSAPLQPSYPGQVQFPTQQPPRASLQPSYPVAIQNPVHIPHSAPVQPLYPGQTQFPAQKPQGAVRSSFPNAGQNPVQQPQQAPTQPFPIATPVDPRMLSQPNTTPSAPQPQQVQQMQPGQRPMSVISNRSISTTSTLPPQPVQQTQPLQRPYPTVIQQPPAAPPVPLPKGWEEIRDPDGRLFYTSKDRKQCTWTRPALANGWIQLKTPDKGRIYYSNNSLQKTSWDHPGFSIVTPGQRPLLPGEVVVEARSSVVSQNSISEARSSVVSQNSISEARNSVVSQNSVSEARNSAVSQNSMPEWDSISTKSGERRRSSLWSPTSLSSTSSAAIRGLKPSEGSKTKGAPGSAGKDIWGVTKQLGLGKSLKKMATPKAGKKLGITATNIALRNTIGVGIPTSLSVKGVVAAVGGGSDDDSEGDDEEEDKGEVEDDSDEVQQDVNEYDEDYGDDGASNNGTIYEEAPDDNGQTSSMGQAQQSALRAAGVVGPRSQTRPNVNQRTKSAPAAATEPTAKKLKKKVANPEAEVKKKNKLAAEGSVGSKTKIMTGPQPEQLVAAAATNTDLTTERSLKESDSTSKLAPDQIYPHSHAKSAARESGPPLGKITSFFKPAHSPSPSTGYVQEQPTTVQGTVARGGIEPQLGIQPQRIAHYQTSTQASTSHQQSGPPHLQSGPPHQQSGPPHLPSGPPHQQSGPPHLHSGPPHQQSGPPHLHSGPPQQQSRPPHLHSGPPQQQSGPPRLPSGPPHLPSSPPHQHPHILQSQNQPLGTPTPAQNDLRHSVTSLPAMHTQQVPSSQPLGDAHVLNQQTPQQQVPHVLQPVVPQGHAGQQSQPIWHPAGAVHHESMSRGIPAPHKHDHNTAMHQPSAQQPAQHSQTGSHPLGYPAGVVQQELVNRGISAPHIHDHENINVGQQPQQLWHPAGAVHHESTDRGVPTPHSHDHQTAMHQPSMQRQSVPQIQIGTQPPLGSNPQVLPQGIAPPSTYGPQSSQQGLQLQSHNQNNGIHSHSTQYGAPQLGPDQASQHPASQQQIPLKKKPPPRPLRASQKISPQISEHPPLAASVQYQTGPNQSLNLQDQHATSYAQHQQPAANMTTEVVAAALVTNTANQISGPHSISHQNTPQNFQYQQQAANPQQHIGTSQTPQSDVRSVSSEQYPVSTGHLNSNLTATGIAVEASVAHIVDETSKPHSTSQPIQAQKFQPPHQISSHKQQTPDSPSHYRQQELLVAGIAAGALVGGMASKLSRRDSSSSEKSNSHGHGHGHGKINKPTGIHHPDNQGSSYEHQHGVVHQNIQSEPNNAFQQNQSDDSVPTSQQVYATQDNADPMLQPSNPSTANQIIYEPSGMAQSSADDQATVLISQQNSITEVNTTTVNTNVDASADNDALTFASLNGPMPDYDYYDPFPLANSPLVTQQPVASPQSPSATSQGPVWQLQDPNYELSTVSNQPQISQDPSSNIPQQSYPPPENPYPQPLFQSQPQQQQPQLPPDVQQPPALQSPGYDPTTSPYSSNFPSQPQQQSQVPIDFANDPTTDPFANNLPLQPAQLSQQQPLVPLTPTPDPITQPYSQTTQPYENIVTQQTPATDNTTQPLLYDPVLVGPVMDPPLTEQGGMVFNPTYVGQSATNTIIQDTSSTPQQGSTLAGQQNAGPNPPYDSSSSEPQLGGPSLAAQPQAPVFTQPYPSYDGADYGQPEEGLYNEDLNNNGIPDAAEGFEEEDEYEEALEEEGAYEDEIVYEEMIAEAEDDCADLI